jgi:hypothetical protein
MFTRVMELSQYLRLPEKIKTRMSKCFQNTFREEKNIAYGLPTYHHALMMLLQKGKMLSYPLH